MIKKQKEKKRNEEKINKCDRSCKKYNEITL